MQLSKLYINLPWSQALLWLEERRQWTGVHIKVRYGAQPCFKVLF